MRSSTAQAAMERSRSRFKKRRISRERPLCRGSPSAGSGSCFSLPPEGSVRPQCCAQKAGETVRPHGLTPERGSGVQPHGRFGRSPRCRRMRARRRSTNDGAGGGAAFRQHGAPAHQGQGAVGPPPFFRPGARAAAGGMEEAKMRAAGASGVREAPGKAAAEEAAGAPEARDASEEAAEAGAGAADGYAADGYAAGAGETGTAGAPEASCEVRPSGSGRREAGNTSGVNSSG